MQTRIFCRITCDVCRKMFDVPATEYNYYKTTTCSEACHAELRSRIAVKRVPETIGRADVQKTRAGAYKASSLCKPGATNSKALWWSLRAPDGTLYHFRNLAAFLRRKRRLFTPETLVIGTGGVSLAYNGLRRLRPDVQGQKNSWHGWTWGIK